jgi:hypothetical protein
MKLEVVDRLVVVCLMTAASPLALCGITTAISVVRYTLYVRKFRHNSRVTQGERILKSPLSLSRNREFVCVVGALMEALLGVKRMSQRACLAEDQILVLLAE